MRGVAILATPTIPSESRPSVNRSKSPPLFARGTAQQSTTFNGASLPASIVQTSVQLIVGAKMNMAQPWINAFDAVLGLRRAYEGSSKFAQRQRLADGRRPLLPFPRHARSVHARTTRSNQLLFTHAERLQSRRDGWLRTGTGDRPTAANRRLPEVSP
jgi:hypothetical protein